MMQRYPWQFTLALDLWPIFGPAGWHWKPTGYRSTAISYYQFCWLFLRVDVYR